MSDFTPGTLPPPRLPWLVHLPLALFAAPMGIGGLGLAWRAAGDVLGVPTFIGEVLLLLAGLVWLVVTGLQILRATCHPEALAGDLRHPIRSAFAGALTIGLMLVAGGLAPHLRGLAENLWLIAVYLHLAIGIWTVRGLLVAPREAATLMPPLVIPLVGNILAPVIGAKLGHTDLSWALFGLGALLWVLIQPAILHRIATGPAIPDKMKPTFVILLAPPAVGASALAALTGGFGVGPTAIWGLAAFIAAVMVTLLPVLARAPFSMAWWGTTFPSASFAAAAIGYGAAHPSGSATTVAWVALVTATVVIAWVSAATVKAAKAGKLSLPEG